MEVGVTLKGVGHKPKWGEVDRDTFVPERPSMVKGI